MPTTNPKNNALVQTTKPSSYLKMSDSDSGDKKASVPSWQQDSAQKPLQEEDKVDLESHPNTATMLEQAKKFLEDEEVKDAPTDKKIAFLESKGVGSEDIQQLLGISRNKEASNTTTSPDTQVTSLNPSTKHNTKQLSRYQNHHLLNPPQPQVPQTHHPNNLNNTTQLQPNPQ
jgi:hypothetical protein